MERQGFAWDERTRARGTPLHTREVDLARALKP